MAEDRITPKVTVGELVDVVEKAERDIREAFATIHAAEQSLTAVFALEQWSSISVPHRYVNYGKPDDAIIELSRTLWRALIDRLEVKRMLSPQAARTLEDQIERGPHVPITQENVRQVVEHFQKSLPDMLRESVEYVFNFLRPRHSRLKTNTQFEVKPKVIIEGALEWWVNHYHVHHHWQDSLRALENVFTALDGKGQISKTYYSHLSDEIGKTGEEGRGATEYFEFKCYRTGNLHLKFKRLDLLKHFNEMAGGRRLKPETTAT